MDMKENTNKAIAINSIILYAKLFVMTICGLLTTRFALQALGVNDFGLFSVLGSIISFIAIFNTVMISTSNRFISVAIGKGHSKYINEQFNICIVIHIAIALFTLFLAIPLGDLYIYKHLNYSGDIDTAVDVFHFTVIGSIISFVGVPYNGLLIAKERFLVFSITEVLTHIFKLAVTFSLLYCFDEKLLIFAFTQGFITAVPTLVYYIYCKRQFSEIVKFNIPRNSRKYIEIFSFSGWVAYGAFATIGKSQGAQILINSFFNTMMNTALGLANTVNGLLGTFSNSIAQPIMPQITKNYASGNYSRCDDLLVMSTKYTFFVTLFISTPFLSGAEWIFYLWLSNIPPYVLDFTTLIIIDTLITSLNSGISNMIFASGKIKLYQISINTLRLFSIFAAYIVLKFGGPAQSLLGAYILFSIIIFFIGQWVLHHTLRYDNTILWKRSYIPSFVILLLLIPFLIFKIWTNSIVNIVFVESYLFVLILFIGLSKSERSKISKLILKCIKK